MTERNVSRLDRANDYLPFTGAAPAISPFALARLLNDAHTLATGVRAVAGLVGNSVTEGCDDEGAPLTPATVEGLLGLVGLASSQFLISLEIAMQEAPHG